MDLKLLLETSRVTAGRLSGGEIRPVVAVKVGESPARNSGVIQASQQVERVRSCVRDSQATAGKGNN